MPIKKAPWMVKGGAVCLPGGMGVIEVVVECVARWPWVPVPLVKPFRGGLTHYLGEYVEVVLAMYVRMEGASQAWPVGLEDVSANVEISNVPISNCVADFRWKREYVLTDLGTFRDEVIVD